MQRWLALAGLVFLLGGAAVIVLTAVGANEEEAAGPTAPAPTETAPTPPPVPPEPVPVKLAGLRGFDPEGDGQEQDATAPLATDGNQTTFWETENYESFFKEGVGLLLDAGRPVKLTRVVVTSDTPGVTAGVQVGTQPDGPFTAVSPTKELAARTTFALRPRNARYVVVWIDDIPGGGSAHLNEVRAWRAGSSS